MAGVSFTRYTCGLRKIAIGIEVIPHGLVRFARFGERNVIPHLFAACRSGRSDGRCACALSGITFAGCRRSGVRIVHRVHTAAALPTTAGCTRST